MHHHVCHLQQQHLHSGRSRENSLQGSESGPYAGSPPNTGNLQRQYSHGSTRSTPSMQGAVSYDGSGAYGINPGSPPTYGPQMTYAYPSPMAGGYTMAGNNMYMPMPGYGMPLAPGPGMYHMPGYAGYPPGIMGMMQPRDGSMPAGMVTMIGQDGMAYAVPQSVVDPVMYQQVGLPVAAWMLRSQCQLTHVGLLCVCVPRLHATDICLMHVPTSSAAATAAA